MSTNAELTILSDSGKFRATITEAEAGLIVRFWYRGREDGTPIWALIHETTVDAPWHVLRDQVHDIVQRLHPDVRSWPTRRTVLSVVR